MAGVTLLDVYDFIARGGLPAIAILILWGGARRWWVFGWQYQELLKRADKYEELALRGTRISSQLTDKLTQEREGAAP